MMKKIKYILLLFSFIFSGCKEPFLNLNGVSCDIDKTSYKVNEEILISCEGSFIQDVGIGNLVLELNVFRLVNDGVDWETEVPITIIDSGSLYKNESDLINQFSAYIYRDEKLSKFNENIKISLSEVGYYRLDVCITGSEDIHPYGGIKFFNYNITVTD